MESKKSGVRPARGWPSELETIALRTYPDATGSHPQAESISLASAWQMESTQAADNALSGASDAYIYRRDGHPNDRSLATKLAQLHAGSRACLTAQGMSAIAAVAFSTLHPKSTVWIPYELYGKSVRLFAHDLANWNLRVELFDPTVSADLERLAGSEVDLAVLETISNPRVQVPNIAKIATAVHQRGGRLMVDNTFATHLLCQPLTIGADLVVESLSKIVCGHSDSMLGVVVGKDENLMKLIATSISTFGWASSPLDCYLTQRGLITLALRLERACETALSLATALSQHACVTKVDYPGLKSHPQHELATQQLTGGFGWMLSFELNTQKMSLDDLLARLRPEIAFLPSLGDACTTISHPASTSQRAFTAEQLNKLGISSATVRVSCGIEPTAYVVDRFLQSLS